MKSIGANRMPVITPRYQQPMPNNSNQQAAPRIRPLGCLLKLGILSPLIFTLIFIIIFCTDGCYPSRSAKEIAELQKSASIEQLVDYPNKYKGINVTVEGIYVNGSTMPFRDDLYVIVLKDAQYTLKRIYVTFDTSKISVVGSSDDIIRVSGKFVGLKAVFPAFTDVNMTIRATKVEVVSSQDSDD